MGLHLAGDNGARRLGPTSGCDNAGQGMDKYEITGNQPGNREQRKKCNGAPASGPGLRPRRDRTRVRKFFGAGWSCWFGLPNSPEPGDPDADEEEWKKNE